MSDRSFSALSQRAFDLQKPGSGPNEWASKIQAMKQQVEVTEEDDHKRLEEEIAAARQARLRRSLGNSAGSRAHTPNLTEQSSITANDEGTLESDLPKSDLDRQSHQDTALQKLMGRNNVYIPDKLPTSTNSSDSVSLASFIGGSASGPKLNKHAPQPNAHDPTQFIQPNTSSPHPVFGRGGVAMPGLATKKSFGSLDSGNKSDYAERYHSSSSATSQKTSTATASNELLKSPPSDTSRNNADINRRSFTATPKSPSPALAARYAEKFEQSPKPSTPIRSQTLQTSQIPPALSQRKSFSSLPSSTAKSNEISTPKYPSSSLAEDYQSPRAFSDNTASPIPTKPPVVTLATASSSVDALRNTTPVSRPVLAETRSLSASAQPTAIKPLDFAKKAATTPDIKPFSSYAAPAFSSKAVEPAKDTPLKRLMENNSVYNPDRKQDPYKAMEQVPVSLAAFIGGTAKGPRLNKHAPQPDAHDPTQFVQPNITAPHPIFGRGGVAMPGMATKTAPSLEEEPSESTRPSNVKSRWPPVTAPPGSRGGARPASPQKTGNRERTTSTPSVPQFSNVTQASNTSYISHVRSSRSVSPSKQRERTLSTPSHSQYPSRAYSSPAPTPVSQTTVAPSYLARPIPPDPKLPSFVPQIPPTTVPSPAFQKSPPPKDPTPSISRLKGRGFVQNMVKASVQLESVPASAPISFAKPRPLSAGKGAVLDRWQPGTSASPTKTSPPPDSFSRPGDHASADTKFSNMTQPTKPLRASASISSIPKLDSESITSPPVVPASREPFQRSRTPGVGSGTTMVLIKPSKSNSDLRQASLVDELGVQTQTPRREHNPPSFQSTPKKPLIHADNAPRPARRPEVELEESFRGNGPFVTPAVQTSDQNAGGDVHFPEVSASCDKAASPKDENKPSHIDPVPTEEREASPIESTRSPPSSPQVTKHTRIPSTGNRATVMELAEAMGNVPEDRLPEIVKQELSPPSPMTPIARQTLSQVQSEKRRSTYEKYSSIMLPPLKEEATPVPSPAGTLGRSQLPANTMAFGELAMVQDQLTSMTSETLPIESMQQETTPLPPQKESQLGDQIICLDHEDDQLPVVDLSKLFQAETPGNVSSNQTISVDLLTIVANTAHPVARNSYVFHETEILVVVHRSKSQESGLVSTVIWCWLGKHCQFRDREDKKLRELAARYGTSPIMVHQLAEPVELVEVLGGRLIIRQGTRSHWSAENTTMHLVRSQGGVIFIDEVDFNIRNLCSAFSFCFTILGTVYVWHGSGSATNEQEAALAYARKLDEHMTPIELFEGTSDEDEIFWMMLGDDAFAQADYWKWRKQSNTLDPRAWRVDGNNDSQPITRVKFISSEQNSARLVYIIDCIWELFVIVGKDARGDKRSIRLALNVAINMSQSASDRCPFSPTVHAIILPSKLPLDLLSNVRDLDEAWLNNGDIPDHMNILPCNEALEHLARREWGKGMLRDPDMLPLGVGISDLL